MTQPVKFGLNVDPNTGGLAIAERITAIADNSGLDNVGIQDHPYNDGFTDTLSLITWLARRWCPPYASRWPASMRADRRGRRTT